MDAEEESIECSNIEINIYHPNTNINRKPIGYSIDSI